MTAALACVALAVVGAGTWLGSVLIRREQVGWGVAVFLAAAVIAGLVTDGLSA